MNRTLHERVTSDAPALASELAGHNTWSRQPSHGFAMVVRMPDNSVDPSGNTEAFKAFSQNVSPEPATASRAPLIIGGLILLVVVAVVLWLVV